MNTMIKLYKNQRVIFFCYAIAIFLFVLMYILKPAFRDPGHLSSLAITAAIMGLFALGQTFVVITGGIDLSIPWMMNSVAVLLTFFTNGKDNMLITVLPILIIGSIAIGAINGLGVAFLGINPLIMTFAMNSILQGALLAFTGGTPGGYASPLINQLVSGKLLGIPILLIFWIIITVIASIVLIRTPYGKKLYAVGNSDRASFFSGVNIKTVKVIAYAISGLSACLGGIAMCAQVGQSYLGMGNDVMFQTLAVVAIGGTSLNGGSGSYIGTVGGAIVLAILLNILSSYKMSSGVQELLYGVVLLIAILFARSRKIAN